MTMLLNGGAEKLSGDTGGEAIIEENIFYFIFFIATWILFKK